MTAWLLVFVAASVCSGCATSPAPQPESMRDPQANFAAYRTFGWSAGGTVETSDAPLRLLDANIRAAIATELRKRGYAEAPAGDTPDLRIAYETASADKIENNPVRVGIGVGSWGGNVGGSVNVGSPSIRNYKEGTLVVHAIDSARNAEVWQGRVSKKITGGSTEPAAIAAAVSAAMKDFPAR
ncbi:MAG TPA: DUF4136 domain-containing protein [Steroidobacteraceae bacterium]|nr:DUF4136 domain-containing protein [Steroidobacteraceae bacterium]